VSITSNVYTMTILKKKKKTLLLSKRDCPSMAVSPDDFVLLYCYLSCYLPSERKRVQKSSLYCFLIGKYFFKVQYRYMHTSEMSIYLLHDRDIQIDQLH
jgi:hypothetical protein